MFRCKCITVLNRLNSVSIVKKESKDILIYKLKENKK